MFYRGQKIVITESNVKGRMHPAVGDAGYIENMFLFPEDRFILASIVMCSYKKGGPRAEHKKFIIDIGMNDTIKSKIDAGVNKLFFLSKESVNLLPAFIHKNKVGIPTARYERMVSFPQIVGTNGIWTGYTSKKKNRNKKCDTRVVIPYGHIKEYGSKCALNNTAPLEIRVWLRSLIPNITALITFYRTINRDEEGNLTDKANSIFTNFGGIFDTIERNDITYLKVKPKALNEIKSSVGRLVIDPMRKLNVMSVLAVYRLYKKYINTYTQYDGPAYIQRALCDRPLYALLNTNTLLSSNVKPLFGKLIVDYIYKSIFIDRNTKLALGAVSDYIPKSWDIKEISRIADEAKSDYNSGSAALNRIFDVISGIKEPESAYSAYDLPLANSTVQELEDNPYDTFGELYKFVGPDTKAKVDKILNFDIKKVAKQVEPNDEPKRRERQNLWGQIDFDNIEVDDL